MLWHLNIDPSSGKELGYYVPMYMGTNDSILAHRIRISDILPWDRKSYLTHAILPRLSREGYLYWLYWNSCTWSSSEVIVMLC